jgi:periplasmic protein TonB
MIFKRAYPALLLTTFSITLLSISGFAKSPATTSYFAALKNIRDTLPVSDSAMEGKIFEAVEEEAYFPGGEQGWRSWLEQNLDPAAPIVKGAPAGLYTVYIQFVVDLDGKVSAIKALTKHGYGMEAEVMRILRKSPPWVPAIQHGKNVRAYRKQPVTFQVVEEKKKRGRRG